jgi:hypothetical protein
MAAHYKIQNKDHEKPPNKGCLENRLEKSCPFQGLKVPKTGFVGYVQACIL